MAFLLSHLRDDTEFHCQESLYHIAIQAFFMQAGKVIKGLNMV